MDGKWRAVNRNMMGVQRWTRNQVSVGLRGGGLRESSLLHRWTVRSISSRTELLVKVCESYGRNKWESIETENSVKYLVI